MNYEISFIYEFQRIEFANSRAATLYIELCNWLYKNGYEFKGEIHNAFIRKPFTKKEAESILSKNYAGNNFNQIFFNVSGSDIYLYRGGNIDKIYPNILKMLLNFGIDRDTITTKGFDQFKGSSFELTPINPLTNTDSKSTQIKRFDEFTDQKYTKLEAAQIVLKQNNNNPMTADAIWNEIIRQDLARKPGILQQMFITLSYHSINSNHRQDWYGKRHKLFMIVEGSPRRFKLVDPESDIVNVSDEDDEDQISAIKIDRSAINQFDTAVCVTGESGVGKSTLVEDLLSEEGHNYEFIIPTSSTTSLLAQYSPKKSSYSPSRLGNLLIEAMKNPNEKYTAVFDEMHKPGVIDMINDELLQAISKERNQGKRFVSVDGDVFEIYENVLNVDEEGNLLIPNNFGFVFITSKEDVIRNNPDLMGRIKIANITEANRDDIQSIDDLIAECDKE